MSTLRQTMVKKYGSLEAWKKHLSEIGKRGGIATRDSGHNPVFDQEFAREMGRRGGQRSIRPSGGKK